MISNYYICYTCVMNILYTPYTFVEPSTTQGYNTLGSQLCSLTI